MKARFTVQRKMMGKVILVGAGPGDRGLLTIKGKKYIETADCILYDRLIGKDILDFAKPGCELIPVGKAKGHHTLPQEGINELLLDRAGKCELVVRLKGGDPYVFGRGAEEALYLKRRGVSVDVVPGVSSSVAALCYAGIPATHRGISRGMRILTTQAGEGLAANVDYSSLTDERETLVFMMSLTRLREVADGLMEAGRDRNTPAAVISDGTLATQKKCVGTLENIAKLAEKEGLPSPGIIVVGPVVSLNEDLSFFEEKPLFGRKLFVPRIRGGYFSCSMGWTKAGAGTLEELLSEMGASLVFGDMGVIKPVKMDTGILEELTDRDYIVLTSQNAVHCLVWNLVEAGRDIRGIGRARIAVVGDGTKKALESFGIFADLVPDKKTAAGLAELLRERISLDTRVVWPSAVRVSPGLQSELEGLCSFQRLVCYVNEKIESKPSKEDIEAFRDCDGIVFTCASNVRRTIERYGAILPERIYSIGPSCSAELEKAGYTAYIEAGKPDLYELAELVSGI